MNERNRLSQVYTQGVEGFIEYATANDVLKLSTIICPCVKCRNRLRFPAVDVPKLLIRMELIRHTLSGFYMVRIHLLHGGFYVVILREGFTS